MLNHIFVADLCRVLWQQHAVPLNDAATDQLTSIPLSGMSTGDVTAVGFSHKEKAIKAQLKQAEDVNTR